MSISHTAIVGIIYHCTRIEVSILRTGRGRGGGGGFFSLLNFFFQKCSWGGDFGVFGSENDTLLRMTITRDRLKFWNGPAWRSKVIIRKPWRRKLLRCPISQTLRTKMNINSETIPELFHNTNLSQTAEYCHLIFNLYRT